MPRMVWQSLQFLRWNTYLPWATWSDTTGVRPALTCLSESTVIPTSRTTNSAVPQRNVRCQAFSVMVRPPGVGERGGIVPTNLPHGGGAARAAGTERRAIRTGSLGDPGGGPGAGPGATAGVDGQTFV